MDPQRPISTPAAPPALGAYSQAIQAGDMLFCSGQIPLDPVTGLLVGATTAAQTEQALQNLQAVLEAGGSGLAHVLKTTVFLTDLSDFPAFNEVYARHFPGPAPARSTVQVAALPRGARVEIEAVARIPS